MLRQRGWAGQNGPITMNGILPATTLFFENFVSVSEPHKKSWFDVPTTQMAIFILFESVGVLFENAFSLWVSLNSQASLQTVKLPENKTSSSYGLIKTRTTLTRH